jgi:hypothetical protein
MQPDMYDICSIDELVDVLGGDTEVASWLGISQPAVANWKVRGQIASGWHLRILARLKKEKRRADPAIFGLTEEEACGLFDRPSRRARKLESRMSAA